MNRLAKAIRSRRENARTRREIARAIDRAPSSSMREELIIMAQRQRDFM